METIEVKGKVIKTLDDGYMQNRELWDEEIAIALAKREDIELTDEHWEVINYLRKYYKEYLISPDVRVLLKHMKETLGEDKVDKKYLYTIFPKGPAFQGCKIAGLPKPTGCIDG
ncbi:MAG: sulfurtransferase TusE [bacterium]|nr:MAG: sulfurtransferase TusE [bacterium]